MKVPFLPMLLERAESAVALDGWVYQVKWDGVRNLTLVQGGEVRHWSRRLRERTPLFPEFAGLADALQGRRAVLDGEIVILSQGRPSFSGILQRDLGQRPDPARLRATPATLMLFDLLEWGEQELYLRPLTERLDLLGRAVGQAERWQVVEAFPGSAGPALFQAVIDQGMEGVVAKRASSSYLPGVRSRDWLKIKRRQQVLAVVCGYTLPIGGTGGLILGAYREGVLTFIGRAGSGISGEQFSLIRSHLDAGPRPFSSEPTLRDRFSGPAGPVVWTRPTLTVVVEFLEWTEEGRLRHPVVKGFSTEPPEAAQIR